MSALTVAVVCPAAVSAQADTAAIPLDEIIVVAEGTRSRIRDSSGAASLLTRAELEATPARALPDLLRQVPGLIFLDRDGAGELPLSIARGFYGGGETEYLLVMLDGVLLNDMRTGAVDWTRVRPASVRRVEVLRGGGSAIYGDQAVGAVVNIITIDPASGERWSGEVAGGAWQDLEGSIHGAASVGAGLLDGGLDLARSDGYRDHSRMSLTSVGASYATPGATTPVSVEMRYADHYNQDAGPLTEGQLDGDRRQANPLFGADERTRRTFEATAQAGGRPGAFQGWTGRLAVQTVDQSQTRTLLLTPSFGDTQLQETNSLTVGGRVTYDGRWGDWSLTAGTELVGGGYDSRYAPPTSPDETLTEGDGSRFGGALMASGQWAPGSRTRVTLGGRYDRIEVSGRDGTAESTFDQVSPRLGLNVTYLPGPRNAGNLYVSLGRSFKAPSLDQLYDERAIPVGPDVQVNLSNPDLKPQRSTDVEVGLYQTLPVWADLLAEVSLAAYRIDLEDEIDFDLETFKYANITESVHDGLELALTLPFASWLAFNQTLTLGRARFGTGDFEGNQLKNIPLTVSVTGFRLTPTTNVGATLGWRYVGSMYLDDANQEEVPSRNVLDLGLDWTVRGATVFATVKNLTDEGGVEGGYMLFDPATNSSERMLYPSGGRYLRIGVRVGG